MWGRGSRGLGFNDKESEGGKGGPVGVRSAAFEGIGWIRQHMPWDVTGQRGLVPH